VPRQAAALRSSEGDSQLLLLVPWVCQRSSPVQLWLELALNIGALKSLLFQHGSALVSLHSICQRLSMSVV
jgi:hypothetical protein